MKWPVNKSVPSVDRDEIGSPNDSVGTQRKVGGSWVMEDAYVGSAGLPHRAVSGEDNAGTSVYEPAPTVDAATFRVVDPVYGWSVAPGDTTEGGERTTWDGQQHFVDRRAGKTFS